MSKKMMLFRALFCCGLLIAVITLTVNTAAASGKKSDEAAEAASQEPNDDVVSEKAAVVNKVVISSTDFERELNNITKQLLMRGRLKSQGQIAQLKQQVLDNMIKREVLYQHIQTKNFTIPDEKVDEQIRALKNRYQSPDEFKEALSQMKVKEDELESRIRRDLVIQSYIDETFTEKTDVSEDEIEALYQEKIDQFKQPEQVQASHILVKVAADAGDAEKQEARKKLEEARKKIEKGGDFAEIAKEISECPSSAKGGDLGFFNRGQMVPPFEQAAFALEKGEMSGLVETRFGFHLIKVTGKKAAETVPLEDMRGQITKYLLQEKVQKSLEEQVGKLMEAAEIERFLD